MGLDELRWVSESNKYAPPECMLVMPPVVAVGVGGILGREKVENAVLMGVGGNISAGSGPAWDTLRCFRLEVDLFFLIDKDGADCLVCSRPGLAEKVVSPS